MKIELKPHTQKIIVGHIQIFLIINLTTKNARDAYFHTEMV